MSIKLLCGRMGNVFKSFLLGFLQYILDCIYVSLAQYLKTVGKLKGTFCANELVLDTSRDGRWAQGRTENFYQVSNSALHTELHLQTKAGLPPSPLLLIAIIVNSSNLPMLAILSHAIRIQLGIDREHL